MAPSSTFLAPGVAHMQLAGGSGRLVPGQLGGCGSLLRARRAVPGRCTIRAVAEPPVQANGSKTATHLDKWSPVSWRERTAHQQPNYPDKVCLFV